MDVTKQKINFISNLNGTTILEVNIISGVSVLCLLLRALVLAFLPVMFKSYLLRFLIDFFIIFVPLICCVTVFSEYVWEGMLLGIVLSVSLLYILLKFQKRPLDTVAHSCYLSPNFYTESINANEKKGNLTKDKKASDEIFVLSSNIPFVSTFRALVNIASCVCILAVDFHIYPRRFAKVEKYGVSVMDLGVGGYIVANAIVSPEARKFKQLDFSKSVLKRSVFSQVLSSWPIILLGIMRMVSVKATGYHEHVSEYGVHWNFFFSLALVRVLSTLILCCVGTRFCKWISAFIACSYQCLLSAPSLGITQFLLSDDYNGNIFIQNKEGIASSIGFIALYFAGVELGSFIFKQRNTLNEWKKAAQQLLTLSILLWLALYSSISYVQPVSRRLGNLSYMLWMLSYSTLFLFLYLLIDVFLVYLISKGSLFIECMPNQWLMVPADAKNKKIKVNHAPPPVTTCLLSAVNRNQLFYFLLCNLLTGLVNIVLQTLTMADNIALVIITGYSFTGALLTWILHVNNISLKFWCRAWLDLKFDYLHKSCCCMAGENKELRKTFTGKLFKNVDHIVNDDGQHLFCKYWYPEGTVKFLFFMVHGFGGHCVRFNELALNIATIGGLACSHDLVGHGESDGNRATVSDYNIFIRDIFLHVDEVKKDYPNVPIYMYGQSMGGALTLISACERPEYFRGIVTVGGMFVMNPALRGPVKKGLLRFASAIMPNLVVSDLTDNQSTRDEAEIESTVNDPLKSTFIKSQMAYQFLLMSERVAEVMPTLDTPVLAIHGEADVTCSVEGSKMLLQVAKSKDKTLKLLKDCHHDVIHEIKSDREQCFEDIKTWLKERIPTPL